MLNLAQACIAPAPHRPASKTALLVAHDLSGTPGEIWTFGALEETMLAIAAGLRAMGLQKGDRIILRLGNTSDFPLLFFGAIAGGFIPVPTSTMLTEAELAKLVEDCTPKLIITDTAHSLQTPPATALHICQDGIDALKNHTPGTYAETQAEDPAFLVYTSGTSGAPKGVLHAHRSILGRAPMQKGWYDLQSDDKLLHAGAFNWTYTLGAGLQDPWTAGATSIIYQGPREPDIWPHLIEAYGATIFAAVPSLYRRILKYATLGPHAMPSLRHAVTAGEALRAELHAQWQTQTGRPLYEALGMSECSTYISSAPSVPTRPGSPGKPQEGRAIGILSSDDPDCTKPLPAGETGLLAIHRSEPGLMLAYWNKPDEMNRAFRGDWFLTGDRAMIDEDGYLWYAGRTDATMNAFGYRVAPEEVERTLAEHPAIHDCAVAAIDVTNDISLITGFIQREPGASLQEDELAVWAKDHLAEYKRPRQYVFVEHLPRNASGKLLRRALRDLVPAHMTPRNT